MAGWDAVATGAAAWAQGRLPRPGRDRPLTLYRDANTWCPHCHKVYFYMEQKALRYLTERIHLQGDPREPPKQAWFLRDVSPGGGVPALAIEGEVVLESLDILRRLDAEFPDDRTAAAPDDDWVRAVVGSSGAFDCDGDAWLYNTEPVREDGLRRDSRAKLDWLEDALGVLACTRAGCSSWARNQPGGRSLRGLVGPCRRSRRTTGSSRAWMSAIRRAAAPTSRHGSRRSRAAAGVSQRGSRPAPISG